MAPFAAAQHLAGDFFDREMGVVTPAPESGAEHQQGAPLAHLVGQLLQLLVGETSGGHIDEVLLG